MMANGNGRNLRNGFGGLVDQWGDPIPPAKLRNSILDGGRDGQPIPAFFTFNAVIGSAYKQFYHGFYDEAIRHSRDDALAMKRDAFLMGLFRKRQRAVTRLKWHLVVNDEKDPFQAEVRDGLTLALRNQHGLRQMFRLWHWAEWYGRYGVQVSWEWRTDLLPDRRCLSVEQYTPVNGDKIGHFLSGAPYILVYGGGNSDDLPDAYTTYGSTAGGRAVTVQGPYRDRVLIAYSDPDDADYFSAEQADAIHGVGLRSQLYFHWWLQHEWIGLLSDYLERVGLGLTIWYYDQSNPNGRTVAEEQADKQSGRVNLVWPRGPSGTGGSGVERIEVPVAGAGVLQHLVQWAESTERLLILGSSQDAVGGQAGTSGAAMAAQEASSDVVAEDAERLENTVNGTKKRPGLLGVMKKFTYPEANFPVRLEFQVDAENSAAKMAAFTQAWGMNVVLREEEVREVIGASDPKEGDAIVCQGLPPGSLAGEGGRPDMMTAAAEMQALGGGNKIGDDSVTPGAEGNISGPSEEQAIQGTPDAEAAAESVAGSAANPPSPARRALDDYLGVSRNQKRGGPTRYALDPWEEHRPFVEAAFANPHDEAPWLIWADKLREQGHDNLADAIGNATGAHHAAMRFHGARDVAQKDQAHARYVTGMRATGDAAGLYAPEEHRMAATLFQHRLANRQPAHGPMPLAHRVADLVSGTSASTHVPYHNAEILSGMRQATGATPPAQMARPGRPARYAAAGHPIGYTHVGVDSTGTPLDMGAGAGEHLGVAAKAAAIALSRGHGETFHRGYLTATREGPSIAVVHHSPHYVRGPGLTAAHHAAVKAGNVLGHFHVGETARGLLRALDAAHEDAGRRAASHGLTPGGPATRASVDPMPALMLADHLQGADDTMGTQEHWNVGQKIREKIEGWKKFSQGAHQGLTAEQAEAARRELVSTFAGIRTRLAPGANGTHDVEYSHPAEPGTPPTVADLLQMIATEPAHQPAQYAKDDDERPSSVADTRALAKELLAGITDGDGWHRQLYYAALRKTGSIREALDLLAQVLKDYPDGYFEAKAAMQKVRHAKGLPVARYAGPLPQPTPAGGPATSANHANLWRRLQDAADDPASSALLPQLRAHLMTLPPADPIPAHPHMIPHARRVDLSGIQDEGQRDVANHLLQRLPPVQGHPGAYHVPPGVDVARAVGQPGLRAAPLAHRQGDPPHVVAAGHILATPFKAPLAALRESADARAVRRAILGDLHPGHVAALGLGTDQGEVGTPKKMPSLKGGRRINDDPDKVTYVHSPPGFLGVTDFFRDPQTRDPVAHLNYFVNNYKDPQSPHMGTGTDKFTNWVKALQAAGVGRVEAHLAGDLHNAYFNGYSYWPKLGFDGTISSGHFGRLPQDLQDQMGGSRSVADLYDLPGGEAAWRQHGGDIYDGTFDATPGSRSMRVLAAAIARGEAKKGGGNVV